MRRVILAGNAITAQILIEYLRCDSRYEVAGLTVDDEYISGEGVFGVPQYGLSKLSMSFSTDSVSIIMASGYADLNRGRESLYLRLKAKGFRMETYVHPDARVYSTVPLGEGSVVLPGSVIEPHVQVGQNAMIWCNVTLAHHCMVQDHSWIASGSVISGKARIERNTFVGVNATVVNEVVVGEYNIIGANALISKDTKARSVYLARSGEPLRYSSEDYVKYFAV